MPKAVFLSSSETTLLCLSSRTLRFLSPLITCFKKVLQLDPTSAIDYANIASNYRELGEKAKAIRYYEMALMLDSSIDFARENLAKMK